VAAKRLRLPLLCRADRIQPFPLRRTPRPGTRRAGHTSIRPSWNVSFRPSLARTRGGRAARFLTCSSHPRRDGIGISVGLSLVVLEHDVIALAAFHVVRYERDLSAAAGRIDHE